jgi:ABC-type phosphate/phosphonate transport system substrate-binding protein
MIASLNMYARPEVNDVLFHFWDLIRKNLENHGISAPASLTQDRDVFEVWTDPTLVLSQTCGMPFRKFLHNKVKLVGTPVYDFEDCAAGHYYSVIVTCKDDPRTTLKEFENARFAYNEENSQSGFAAPLNYASKLGVKLSNRVPSGGHVKSNEMIANGLADIAALDAVSWKLIERHDAFSSALRIVECTKPTTPGLPFITSMSGDADAVFTAIVTAIEDLTPEERDCLCLKGIKKISSEKYLSVPNPTL